MSALTPERLAEDSMDHVKFNDFDECKECGHDWPCSTREYLDLLAEKGAMVATLDAGMRGLADENGALMNRARQYVNERDAALARLAKVEALATDEAAAMDAWWAAMNDDWAVPNWAPGKFLSEVLRRAALAEGGA